MVIHITSLIQFKDKLFLEDPEKNRQRYLIIDFSAKWCGPCKRIHPMFAFLAEKYQEISFLKVDVDEVPELADKYKVKSLPTFIVLRAGDDNPLRIITGADKILLEQTVELISVGHYDDPLIIQKKTNDRKDPDKNQIKDKKESPKEKTKKNDNRKDSNDDKNQIKDKKEKDPDDKNQIKDKKESPKEKTKKNDNRKDSDDRNQIKDKKEKETSNFDGDENSERDVSTWSNEKEK